MQRTVVALGLAAISVIGVLAGTELAGERVSYAGTVPLALLLGSLVLVRRRRPIGVLVASVTAVIALRTSGLTGAGWIWPASVAYFTAAAEARRRGVIWALGIGATELGFAANWEVYVLGRDPHAVLGSLGAETLWLVALTGAALALVNQRRWQGEAAESARLAAQQRAAQERLRIARELHDVVAHTLTVVGVHLRLAGEALDDSPDEARAALRTAQEVRSSAMADLRALIGVLREAEPQLELAPQASWHRVADLIAQTRAAGLKVDLEATVDPAGLPAPAQMALYRVIQESLTNTVRHARATRATLRLTRTGDTLTLEIADDGAGPIGGASAPGHGIDGMRERITALGGRFHAGPAGDPGASDGFLVRAEIPAASW